MDQPRLRKVLGTYLLNRVTEDHPQSARRISERFRQLGKGQDVSTATGGEEINDMATLPLDQQSDSPLPYPDFPPPFYPLRNSFGRSSVSYPPFRFQRWHQRVQDSLHDVFVLLIAFRIS
jgi:hypothetical protein